MPDAVASTSFDQPVTTISKSEDDDASDDTADAEQPFVITKKTKTEVRLKTDSKLPWRT